MSGLCPFLEVKLTRIYPPTIAAAQSYLSPPSHALPSPEGVKLGVILGFIVCARLTVQGHHPVSLSLRYQTVAPTPKSPSAAIFIKIRACAFYISAPPTSTCFSALYLEGSILRASTAMVVLYVKGKGEEAPPTEVFVKQVEGMAVQDLLDSVAQTMSLDKGELRAFLYLPFECTSY